MQVIIYLILPIIFSIIVGEFIVISNLPYQKEIEIQPIILKSVERTETSQTVEYSTTKPILKEAEKCYSDDSIKTPNCLDFTYDGVNGIIEIILPKEIIPKIYHVTIPYFFMVESPLPFDLIAENEDYTKIRIILPEGESTVRIEGESFPPNLFYVPSYIL